MRLLINYLERFSSQPHSIFTLKDLRALMADLSMPAFKTILSRAVKAGYLERACRGLYLFPKAIRLDGLLLFHIAARLRAEEFNYISLETVLSEAVVISQIPMNWISIMSSGRSNHISCGRFGTIEFVHTTRKPTELMEQLTYDARCGLWCADVALALQDMRITHRNLDLINWNIANEFI